MNDSTLHRRNFLVHLQGQSLAELIRTASLDLAERLRLAMASKRPRLESPGITAPTPALSAGAGRSLSGVFMRWTRWCARSAVARCGSSRSSPTTTSRTRSCDTSRRPRRGLLAVHRAWQLSPPLPEPISAAAACAESARGGGGGVRGRGLGVLCWGKAHQSASLADSGACSKRANSPWDPKRRTNAVLTCSRINLQKNGGNFLFLLSWLCRRSQRITIDRKGENDEERATRT